jgi:sulfite exporter TauE/SafE
MKDGIHLGPPPGRSPAVRTAILVAAAVLALALGVLYQRARADVRSLAREVERLEEALSQASPAPSTAEARLVAARLRLALASGASSSVPPTALLRLVETALPGGVRLSRVSFGSSPSPSLTLEASSASSDRVTELQRRLAASPLVSSTALLEERRLPEGRLAIRLQVSIDRR